MEDVPEVVSRDVGVKIENDKSTLIVTIRKGGSRGNSELGPQRAARNEARSRRRVGRIVILHWRQNGRVIDAKPVLVLHVLLTYGIQSCMRSSQIIKMDG